MSMQLRTTSMLLLTLRTPQQASALPQSQQQVQALQTRTLVQERRAQRL